MHFRVNEVMPVASHTVTRGLPALRLGLTTLDGADLLAGRVEVVPLPLEGQRAHLQNLARVLEACPGPLDRVKDHVERLDGDRAGVAGARRRRRRTRDGHGLARVVRVRARELAIALALALVKVDLVHRRRDLLCFGVLSAGPQRRL